MHSRFDTESRIAVAQAADIARELGHREVGPGHLLAGLLANPRGTAYAALRDHGLDLDTARDLVAEHHADSEPEPDRPAAADRYDDDREALRAIGIDLDRVREAVRTNLGDDLADGWGGRGGREGGRVRGRRHGHEGRGRGRRGPRSRREGPQFSPALRAVLREARHATLRDRVVADGRHDDRKDDRRAPGLSGPRLLLALTRSDDPAATAVLAHADGLDALRVQARASIASAPEA
jgi:hypothetical protein